MLSYKEKIVIVIRGRLGYYMRGTNITEQSSIYLYTGKRENRTNNCG